MGNPFFDATTVRPLGPGRDGPGDAGRRFAADLDSCWNLRPLPQGGIVTATAVRAMQAALDNGDHLPRTLHTVFAAQVADGPLEIDVDVLRRGRSMSHVSAEVRNQGAQRGHLTTCVFGGPRDGFEFTDLAPPVDVPHPDDCPSYRDPAPDEVDVPGPVPFWDSLVEGRAAIGHPPWEDYVPDKGERVSWYRFDDPPRLDDGQLDPLALIVLADTMPGAVGEKIGPQERSWFAPSVDLTIHLIGGNWSPWVLAYNRAHFAGGGYASAEMTLWDVEPENPGREARLVAYATQLFLFSFLD